MKNSENNKWGEFNSSDMPLDLRFRGFKEQFPKRPRYISLDDNVEDEDFEKQSEFVTLTQKQKDKMLHFTYPPTQTKTCTKCKEEKEIGDFYIRRSRNNQPKSICKKCESLRFAKPIKIIPDLEGEIWKDVVGFEGIYIVSNKERVRRIMHRTHPTNKLMTNTLTPSGYVCVSLTANGKGKYSLLHIVVAKAFIQNPLNLPEVNHIDGNKANNKVENLEWNTSLENIQHAWKTGLSTPKKGERHSQSKLTEKDVLEIRASNLNHHRLSVIYKVSAGTISKIVYRQRWTHI